VTGQTLFEALAAASHLVSDAGPYCKHGKGQRRKEQP